MCLVAILMYDASGPVALQTNQEALRIEQIMLKREDR